MTKIAFIPLVFLFFVAIGPVESGNDVMKLLTFKVGDRVEIQFSAVPKTISRHVQPERNQPNQEQIFTVCNGKNKKKCGFWEVKETKKKVQAGTPNYNVKKNMLIYPKVALLDKGLHTTNDNQMYYVLVA